MKGKSTHRLPPDHPFWDECQIIRIPPTTAVNEIGPCLRTAIMENDQVKDLPGGLMAFSTDRSWRIGGRQQVRHRGRKRTLRTMKGFG